MSSHPETPTFDEALSLAIFAGDLRAAVFRSQAEAARHLPPDRATISRYEQGKHLPPLGYLACLVRLVAERLAQATPTRPADHYHQALLHELNRAILLCYPGEPPMSGWAALLRAADGYLAPQAAGTRTKQAKARQQTMFAGRQAELQRFRQLLHDLSETSGDMLVISGIGGIGKSSLLDQYQQIAEAERVPVARLDLNHPDQGTIYGLLTSIYQQLTYALDCNTFQTAMQRHAGIETRLIESDAVPVRVLRMFGKGRRAVAPLPDPTAPSPPTIGPDQIDAYIGAIYRVVGRQDGDFWMQPEAELTTCLLADLNTYCANNRLVVMIDTYERAGLLDGWVREHLFAHLGCHALLVLAGRHRPDLQDWATYTAATGVVAQIDLQPLSEAETSDYLRQKNLTDTDLVADINRFAQGHPLTLALLVGQHHTLAAGDLLEHHVQQDLVRRLLNRLLRHVPDTLRTALYACAVLRTVNEASLGAMLEQDAVSVVYDEILACDFVKVHRNGFRLHDLVWDALNADLRWRNPARYQSLHARAADYYVRGADQQATHYELEHLYHLVCSAEQRGVEHLRELAEERIRYGLITHLQELLQDVQTYPLEHGNSRLWRDYYLARLADLSLRQEEAIQGYERIGAAQRAEPLLRAYALHDLGYLLSSGEWVGRAGVGIARVRQIVQQSIALVPGLDAKLVNNYAILANLARLEARWDETWTYMEQMKQFYAVRNDNYGLARVYLLWRDRAFDQTRWRAAFQAWETVAQLLPDQSVLPGAHEHLSGIWVTGVIWTGRLAVSEQSLRELIGLIEEAGEGHIAPFLRELGLTLGLQGRYTDAETLFARAYALDEPLGAAREVGIAITLTFRGIVDLRQGRLDAARAALQGAVTIKERYNDQYGLPEIYPWLGHLEEVCGDWNAAETAYQRTLDLRMGRDYFDCLALAGLVRVHAARHNDAAIGPLLGEALARAHTYEYYDVLAALHLTQGHMAWDGSAPTQTYGEAALHHYQQALIYALHYNRFLLDEVLWGSGSTSPLPSVVAVCRMQGAAGMQLLAALREWWQDEANSIAPLHAETISRLPAGLALPIAEQQARRQEPGDGSTQLTVDAYLKRTLEGSV